MAKKAGSDAGKNVGPKQQATSLTTIDRSGNRKESFRYSQDSKWMKWLIFLAISGWFSEKRRQQNLTCFPLVLRQRTDRNDALCSLLSAVLLRRMQPRLFSGTRGLMNTLFGLTNLGFRRHRRHANEYMTNPFDRSKILVDWELPETCESDLTIEKVLSGSIHLPVVLIVPDLGDGTESDYVRRMMRACTDRGWIAAAIDNKVRREGTNQNRVTNRFGPRSAIEMISRRLQEDQPLFLVSYSLGCHFLADSSPKNLAASVLVNSARKVGDGVQLDGRCTTMVDVNSCSHIALLQIPTMVIWFSDSRAVPQNSDEGLQRCLSNPNIIVVKANIGDQLQRACRSKSEKVYATWVDVAATKFFDAVIREKRSREPDAVMTLSEVAPMVPSKSTGEEAKPVQTDTSPARIRSRL